MKKELTNEEEVCEAIEDIRVAMLDDLQAKKKIEDASREKTRTHYTLLKAKERLSNLERSFIY